MPAPKKIITIHFSGTGTTKKVVDTIAAQFDAEREEYDLLAGAPAQTVTFPSDALVIVGMPVYAGRIPALARMRLEMFRGTATPTVAVAVYGNRAFDDALLELVDAMAGNGGKVFAAGAFLAEHSIFPAVAAGRPDATDIEKITAFAKECASRLETGSLGSATVEVPGKRPYVTPGKSVGLQPLIDDKTCTRCGACIKICPTQALSLNEQEKKVVKDLGRCIPCSACIKVCPTGSQAYRGTGYETYAKIFEEKNAKRQEPELFWSAL